VSDTVTSGQPDDEYDPLAVFQAMAAGPSSEELYGRFADLRAEGPVHPEGSEDAGADTGTAEGVGNADVTQIPPWGPDPRFVTVSFQAAQAVLGNPDMSSGGYYERVSVLFGHSMIEMDEPEHKEYRSLIAQAFTRKAMDEWEVDLAVPLVNSHIDSFVQRGRADLVRELTFPYPIEVISGMLGLPSEDLASYRRWAVELLGIINNVEVGFAASQKLGQYFGYLIAERRKAGRNDLISVLTRAEKDGQKLTDDEIIAFLRLLLPAGAETTTRSLGNLILGLLTHPDQLDALRSDRSLMPQVIDEGLRWETSLISVGRTPRFDTDVCGVAIAAGSSVTVSLGAANRDEARWENPDKFDIFRPRKAHMAFGHGPHTCIGMHLARMETQVAITALLDRLPNLRLDPKADPKPVILGQGLRSPNRLPVLFG
jgi:cytochrome P450